MADIVKLEPTEVGEDYRSNPEELLKKAIEHCRECGVSSLVIIGEDPDDDDPWVMSIANAGQTLILMERAKLELIK